MWNRIIAANRGSAEMEHYIKNQISHTHKIILDQPKLQKVFVFGSDGNTSIFLSGHVSSSQTTQYSLAMTCLVYTNSKVLNENSSGSIS